MYKHGLRGNIIYNTWKHIRGRRYCPTDKAYKNYGGRGITVCDEWRDDPVAFYNWLYLMVGRKACLLTV